MAARIQNFSFHKKSRVYHIGLLISHFQPEVYSRLGNFLTVRRLQHPL